MKKTVLAVSFSIAFFSLFSQTLENQSEGFPHNMTEQEIRNLENGNFSRPVTRGIETAPDFDNLRSMAEWEEIQALTVTLTQYPTIIKEIVRHAKEECTVYVLTDDVTGAEDYLLGNSAEGPLDNLDNVVLVDAEYDSIWTRDYAANPVYGNEVDDLILVDWIYNRPDRVNDDATPSIIADLLGLDLYCMTQAPSDLVNTGGNYMSDGSGTVFQSELILEENEPSNYYGVTAKSQEDIEEIMNNWLGTDNYILMPTLPFDVIHHIDMHMKLLDEETILVGDFGDLSDGPQIQANIEFVTSNSTTKFGTPWKIVWIPMVPNGAGEFADDSWWDGPYYRTFTNSVFVNNTILVPTYREEYDTTAIRIFNEQLPGYNVVSIDCDNPPGDIISSLGAIHCITHSVGVEDPLLISHNPLENTDIVDEDYLVEAYVNHRSGVANVTMHWRLEGETDYSEIAMVNVGGNDWEALIPAHPVGSTIEYYVHAEANSGKMINRPMPAPEGYWNFKVLGNLVNIPNNEPAMFSPIYPNPASAITVVPVVFEQAQHANISILDAQGKNVKEIHSGLVPKGEKKFFFNASELSPGLYNVVVSADNISLTQSLIVK